MNFTLASNEWNGASNDDRSLTVARLPVRSSCILFDFLEHQLNADSRVHTHIHTYISTYTHYINNLPVGTVFRIYIIL